MKKVTKTVSTLLLVVLVVCSLVSCTSAPVVTQAPTVAPTPTPAEPTEDPIKWKGTISVAPYMFGPLDEANNVIKPLLEEALLEYGYDVDLQHVYIENAQYLDLLNVRIAGGDAPDIFEAKSATVMRDYYAQGSIASWDKAHFEQLCPTITSYVATGGVDGRLKDYVDMFWDFAMVDGKMVTVPGFHEAGTMLPKVMLMRGDWLENLGVKDLPTKLDDFIDLMYKFAKDDPDKDGQADTYGFSTTVIRAVFGSFYGYTSFPDPTRSSRIEFYNLNGDGKIVCGDVMETNKEALAILQKCYADGVIDPEFIAQGGENTGGYWALSQPFINGRIGASCLASIAHYQLPEITGTPGSCAKEYFAVNGNYNYVYAPWPAGPKGNFGGWSLGPACGIGENAVYNAKVDNAKLDAILSMMDIFAKDTELALLGSCGIEGTHYDKAGTADKPTTVSKMPNEQLNAAGVMAYRGFYGGPSPLNPDIVRMGFYNNPVFDNIFTWQAKPGYKGGYNRDVYDSTASTGTLAPELLSYRDETFIKIIRGELAIDYYDTYVQEYMKRGGETLTKEAQEWYDGKSK